MKNEGEMKREEGRRFAALQRSKQTSGKTHRETESSEECKIFLQKEAKMQKFAHERR